MMRKLKIKLVTNWREGYKWLSNWAFVLVVFLATTPLPPELLMLLPEDNQKHLIATVALAGLILRFVRQSKANHHD